MVNNHTPWGVRQLKIDIKKGILHSPIYTFFEKACIIKLNDDVETGNSKLGNAFASLCFSQFQVSNFTVKIQDQQSVNYFWDDVKDAYSLFQSWTANPLQTADGLSSWQIQGCAKRIVFIRIRPRLDRKKVTEQEDETGFFEKR